MSRPPSLRGSAGRETTTDYRLNTRLRSSCSPRDLSLTDLTSRNPPTTPTPNPNPNPNQLSLTELTNPNPNPNPNPNQVSLLELTFPDDAALRILGYGAFAVRDAATDYY